MSLARNSIRYVTAWAGVLGLVVSFTAAAAEPAGTTIGTEVPLAVGTPTAWGNADSGSDATSILDAPVDSSCGPPGCTWVRAELLLWWTNGAETPPLVASGIAGTPGATVLFGDEPVNDGLRPGFRVAVGKWLDCQQTRGVEFGFLWLGDDADGIRAGSADGSAIVSRPFIDAGTGQASSELVSFPGLLAGFAEVDTDSTLLGADALVRHNLCCDCCNCWDACDCSRVCIRRDLLFGFRYLRFSDRLTITEELMPLDPIFVPGTQLNITDDFQAQNDFYGLKLGLALERYWGPWSMDVRPQVSLGAIHRDVEIRGQTVVAIPGAPTQQSAGGLYALSSNIGDYSSTQFAVVPELDVRFGYLIRPNLRLLAGYSLLFIPNVARAGEQIDPVINTQLLPPVVPPVTGPQRPAFPDNDSDLWVQGLNLGVEWRF